MEPWSHIPGPISSFVLRMLGGGGIKLMTSVLAAILSSQIVHQVHCSSLQRQFTAFSLQSSSKSHWGDTYCLSKSLRPVLHQGRYYLLKPRSGSQDPKQTWPVVCCRVQRLLAFVGFCNPSLGLISNELINILKRWPRLSVHMIETHKTSFLRSLPDSSENCSLYSSLSIETTRSQVRLPSHTSSQRRTYVDVNWWYDVVCFESDVCSS